MQIASSDSSPSHTKHSFGSSPIHSLHLIQANRMQHHPVNSSPLRKPTNQRKRSNDSPGFACGYAGLRPKPFLSDAYPLPNPCHRCLSGFKRQAPRSNVTSPMSDNPCHLNVIFSTPSKRRKHKRPAGRQSSVAIGEAGRLTHTASKATSAGVTPLILPACPSVSGRIELSFCTASKRKPRISA